MKSRQVYLYPLIVCQLLGAATFSPAQTVPTDSLLTLPRALAIATRNYPSIKNKLAEIQASEADLAARRASFLPGAAFQAQALYGTANGVRGPYYSNEGTAIASSGSVEVNGPTSNAVWGSFGSLLVNWRAVTFGKNKSILAAAQADIGRANADYQQELFMHQVRVADAYLMALIYEQAVSIQVANLGRIQAFRQVMQATTRAGIRPGVDSALANAEVARAYLLVIDSRRLAQQQQVRLGELMGLTGRTFQLDTTTFQKALPVDFQHNSSQLSRHPVLRLYQSLIESSLARAEVIRKSYLPSVSLLGAGWARGSGIANAPTAEGNFVYNPSLGAGLPFRVGNYFLGVSTLWRFTDVFRTRQETRAQLFHTRALQQRYEQEQLGIQSQQQSAQLQWQSALEAARQAPIQLNAAQAAYGQAQARYTTGLSNLVEYAQAFALLNRAEIDQSVTTNNAWRSLLLKAAAEGDITLFTQSMSR